VLPFAKKVKGIKESSAINHFIIIPNYKEPLYKLEKTLDAVVANDYPHKTIHLVLAFEKREEDGPEKERILREKYGYFFKDVMATYHVLQPHEAAGKASNQTHAARKVAAYTEQKGYDDNNVIISICDADSIYPENYFSYLTYEYLRDKERQYHFYWAPVLLYNNFWDLPFFVRVQATLSSILRLGFLSQRHRLIQISTYSTSLWLLKQIDYWDVDIIPEDWHVYFQAFFTFGEKVQTIPLYTIVNGDAVYAGGVMKTLVSRYEQEKRWAWGVSDVAYAWNKFFTTPHLNPLVKIRKILQLAETHVLWPTSFFILTISASIPPLLNPAFKRTVLGFLLPNLSALILTFSSLMLIIYLYLDVRLRNKLNIENKYVMLPLLLIQWYFLPIVSFILSALPALDAHTRMLIGKKMEYKVTEKM
jgi:hypothetical protein